jgi:PIN domain nuclease of toxin-antitoxin system
MRGGPVTRRTSDPELLLLDTHVWLWLVAGSPDLSREARHTIDEAAAVGMLRIAAISLWEVALLASRGRIVLGKSIGLWLEEALADPGPAIDPLSPLIAVESYALPDVFHRDPADRLIVATARVANATLMTRDQRILDYAARGHLTAVAA